MVNNLAGKYRAGYGTPFDLSEVSQLHDSLDVQQITHIRLIDVIGAINGVHISLDTDGQPINDPYPTPFPSCGFDLDAIGVIHPFVGLEQLAVETWSVYPNPANGMIHFSGNVIGEKVLIRNVAGQVIYNSLLSDVSLDLTNLPEGFYLIELNGQQQRLVIER
jgi:hypothetical protein